MIKLAVCDDSKRIVGEIEDMIETLFHTGIDYDSFYSGEELLHYLEINEDETYDIFLLDIEMGKISGLETAKSIREKNKEAIIIFITSHDELVYDSFEVFTFRFIVKPLSIEKLSEALDKAIAYLNVLNKRFSFRYNNIEKCLNSSDIIYFESDRRKMYLYTVDERFLFYNTVAETYEKLEKLLFVKCHASFIVNMKYVEEISRDSLLLTNGMKIPISNRYRETTFNVYHDFLRRKM